MRDCGASAILDAVLAALAFALASSLGAAPEEAGELELRWVAPPTCPDEARVRARVEALLGRPLGPGPAVLKVRAEIERGRAFRLRLTTSTADGSRTRPFEGQSCDVLADAAILAIAIAIDPTVTSRALQPTPAPNPEPSPEEEPPPEAEPPPEPEVRAPLDRDAPPSRTPSATLRPPPSPGAARPRPRGAVRLGAGAAFGFLPRIGPSLTGAAALLLPRARAELHFDHFFAERELDDTGRGGEIRLWTIGLRGCWVGRAVEVLEFPLCGGAQIGSMHARGVGALQRRDETSLPYAAGNAAAALMYVPLRFLAVGIGAEMIVPFTRPGFVLEDLGLVYRTGPVAGRAWAGLEARFP